MQFTSLPPLPIPPPVPVVVPPIMIPAPVSQPILIPVTPPVIPLLPLPKIKNKKVKKSFYNKRHSSMPLFGTSAGIPTSLPGIPTPLPGIPTQLPGIPTPLSGMPPQGIPASPLPGMPISPLQSVPASQLPQAIPASPLPGMPISPSQSVPASQLPQGIPASPLPGTPISPSHSVPASPLNSPTPTYSATMEPTTKVDIQPIFCFSEDPTIISQSAPMMSPEFSTPSPKPTVSQQPVQPSRVSPPSHANMSPFNIILPQVNESTVRPSFKWHHRVDSGDTSQKAFRVGEKLFQEGKLNKIGFGSLDQLNFSDSSSSSSTEFYSTTSTEDAFYSVCKNDKPKQPITTKLSILHERLKLLDADGDGKVTQNDLITVLDEQELGPFASAVGKKLFRTLDRDKDGKLTLQDGLWLIKKVQSKVNKKNEKEINCYPEICSF